MKNNSVFAEEIKQLQKTLFLDIRLNGKELYCRQLGRNGAIILASLL